MVRAELHRRVDCIDRADALVERIDRLVDHRQQDAVHDEGGKILCHREHLPIFTRSLGRLECLVVGGDAAYELYQLHHRHRVHEVHADEALGPVGGGGEAGDRNGGGVGGEERVGGKSSAEIGEDFSFYRFVLG